MEILGFVAYHHPLVGKRLVFIDQILATAKNQRYGTYLIGLLASHPIEIRVHTSNSAAISFYSRLGFCRAKSQIETYPEDDGNFCMRTSSYLRTKRIVESILVNSDVSNVSEYRYLSWSSIPEPLREQMVAHVAKAHGYSDRYARSVLRGTGQDGMQYVILVRE